MSDAEASTKTFNFRESRHIDIDRLRAVQSSPLSAMAYGRRAFDNVAEWQYFRPVSVRFGGHPYDRKTCRRVACIGRHPIRRGEQRERRASEDSSSRFLLWATLHLPMGPLVKSSRHGNELASAAAGSCSRQIEHKDAEAVFPQLVTRRGWQNRD